MWGGFFLPPPPAPPPTLKVRGAGRELDLAGMTDVQTLEGVCKGGVQEGSDPLTAPKPPTALSALRVKATVRMGVPRALPGLPAVS